MVVFTTITVRMNLPATSRLLTSFTVHLYFMNSPFFDPQSNNGAVNVQAQYNPVMFATVQDRSKFEAHLKGMTGLEYMVVDSPTDLKQGESPIWVIRKQERRKRAKSEDQITVLGTYYVIGENVYQAPSVESILSSKLMSITNCLSGFLSVATTLPLFSPAAGHQYLLASAEKSKKRGDTSTSRAGSRPPTPGGEELPPFEAEAGPAKSGQEITETQDDLRLLGESLNLAFRYGEEYMDENPLHGEPGNFVFASSTEHLRAQQQAERTKAAAAAAAATSAASGITPSSSKRSSGPPSPLPEIKTQGLEQPRKGSKLDAKSPVSAGVPKLKRKKTGKATINSPEGRSQT